jgi:SAM-dependent methyltransferase
MSTAQFYDGLADTYHALYRDWHGASQDQAQALHRLLGRWHRGPADIADVACGIGTQLIGLAGLGHRVVGSDISARAVQRARRECAAAGVQAALLVADMRSLPLGDCCADAVICADNALPHLLADGDVLAALAQMSRVLRPGGTVIVTTRDYDRVLADPPASTLPQVHTSGGGRVISFQLWAWRDEAGIYDLEHYQVREGADGTRTTERRTATYRAYARAGLTGLAAAAGLRDITWHMPGESGFFQPVMTARRPALAPAVTGPGPRAGAERRVRGHVRGVAGGCHGGRRWIPAPLASVAAGSAGSGPAGRHQGGGGGTGPRPWPEVGEATVESAATVAVRSRPSPDSSRRMVSPAASGPTPAGVPVVITSPG